MCIPFKRPFWAVSQGLGWAASPKICSREDDIFAGSPMQRFWIWYARKAYINLILQVGFQRCCAVSCDLKYTLSCFARLESKADVSRFHVCRFTIQKAWSGAKSWPNNNTSCYKYEANLQNQETTQHVMLYTSMEKNFQGLLVKFEMCGSWVKWKIMKIARLDTSWLKVVNDDNAFKNLRGKRLVKAF